MSARRHRGLDPNLTHPAVDLDFILLWFCGSGGVPGKMVSGCVPESVATASAVPDVRVKVPPDVVVQLGPVETDDDPLGIRDRRNLLLPENEDQHFNRWQVSIPVRKEPTRQLPHHLHHPEYSVCRRAATMPATATHRVRVHHQCLNFVEYRRRLVCTTGCKHKLALLGRGHPPTHLGLVMASLGRQSPCHLIVFIVD